MMKNLNNMENVQSRSTTSLIVLEGKIKRRAIAKVLLGPMSLLKIPYSLKFLESI